MKEEASFPGFPSSGIATPIPDAFFAEVLPSIEDVVELKVTLIALRYIRKQKGAMRWVAASEVVEAPEIGSLPGQNGDRDMTIRRALEAAAARGVFVALPLARKDRKETAYFINDAEGRRAVERVRTGAVSIGLPVETPTGPMKAPETNIFRLYEEAFGHAVPGAALAEELKDAERDYSAEWLRDAFCEAAAHEVRSWAYVRAILARWRDEGRSNGTIGGRAAQARYRSGKYGRVVRWK